MSGANLPDPIGDAVRRLLAGGLVAYPTETVWGLAADARSEVALEALRRWKGREVDEPVSILVASADAARRLGCRIDGAAARLAETLWPGPLTLVVPCSGSFASGVARADGAVGLRCSSHPLAGALARRIASEGGGPLTATSLNRSGSPAAKSAEDAAALCADDEGPLLLAVEAAECGGDGESTVVDVTGPTRVLRWGSIVREEIEQVIGAVAG